jgi:hypothetical protein
MEDEMKNIVEKMIELNSFWMREDEDFIVDKKSYVCDGFFDISSICLNSELLSLYVKKLLDNIPDEDLKDVTSVFGISRKPEEVLFAAEVAKQLNLKVIYCNSKANGDVVPGKKVIGHDICLVAIPVVDNKLLDSCFNTAVAMGSDPKYHCLSFIGTSENLYKNASVLDIVIINEYSGMDEARQELGHFVSYCFSENKIKRILNEGTENESH